MWGVLFTACVVFLFLFLFPQIVCRSNCKKRRSQQLHKMSVTAAVENECLLHESASDVWCRLISAEMTLNSSW
jgi:hypothetical protein